MLVIQDLKSTPVELQDEEKPQPTPQVPKPQYDNDIEVGSDFVVQNLLTYGWNEAKENIKKIESPRTLLQLGDIQLLRKNSSRAIAHYAKAIDLNPKMFAAYNKIILALMVAGRIQEADSYYQKFIKVTSRRSDFLHQYALFKLFFFQQESIKEVEEILKELVRNNPENHEIANSYGFLNLNFKNNISEAKDYFAKTIKLNDHYPYAYNNLGVCFSIEKNFKKAVDYYLKALKIKPDYREAYENLSNAYINTSELNKAVETLQKAIQMKCVLSREWEHQIPLLLLKLKRFSESRDYYFDLIEKEEGNDLLYYNVGVSFLKEGKIAEAKNYFEKAVDILRLLIKRNQMDRIRKGSVLAFYNLGLIAADEKDDSVVDGICTDLKKLNIDDPHIPYIKSVLALNKADYEQAKALLLDVIKKNDKLAGVYPNLSFIYSCIDKNHSKAIKLLENVIKQGANDPIIDNNLAYSYILTGKITKAEKILKKYDGQELLPTTLATKGLLEFRKGNHIQGEKLYSESIDKMSGEFKKVASQILNYEKSKYLFGQGNIKGARIELDAAKKYGKTYMSSDIKKLEKEINTTERKTR